MIKAQVLDGLKRLGFQRVQVEYFLSLTVLGSVSKFAAAFTPECPRCMLELLKIFPESYVSPHAMLTRHGSWL